ncbi:MAG: SMP-30/gluconolactonase/LRE family protein [Alphaproteobacteria bacterium]
MFAPPPETTARVHSRLPDNLRRPGHVDDWVTFKRQGHPTDCFLEGPAFDRDGNLYVVNIPFGQVLRLDKAGQWNVAVQYDGEPNGLAIHKDGRLFLADSKWGIMVADPVNGKVQPFVTRPHMERFKGCNDLVFAANGDLYFTDQGETGLHDPTGRLFRLGANGRLDCVLDNVPSPNGLVLTPDEKIVYLAVTRGNNVWRVPLLPGGGVTRVGVFIQLTGSLGGPDGMAMAEDGSLAIAHIGLGTAWLFSRIGEPSLRIRSPLGLFTSNVAFGPPGERALYIVESETGTILRADVPVAGTPLYSHR